MGESPSANGPNGGAGRDPATGRFAPGWKGGPGNPHAKQVGKLRSAMLAAVSQQDMKAIVKTLVELASQLRTRPPVGEEGEKV